MPPSASTTPTPVVTLPTIGVVGGTGPAGRGLSLRLAAAGYQVLVGSREQRRAAEVVNELKNAWPERTLALCGVGNGDAADADLVVMAAPWEAVLSLAVTLKQALDGKTVVTMANALARFGGTFSPVTLPRGSVAGELQGLLPQSDVVGAFHHLPAKALSDLDRRLGAEVLVCGDDAASRTDVLKLVSHIAGLRGIDAGTLSSAGAIEAMTAVLIHINVTYKTHSMLRLVGNFDVQE